MDYSKIDTLRGLCIDTEYNNIQSWKATKIWCISTEDLQTGEIKNFHPSGEGSDQYHDQFGDDFLEYIKDYDYFVGHHFHGAEAPVIKNLLGHTFDPETIVDTLVLSRVLRPTSPKVSANKLFRARGWDNRNGGHSLKAWGKRLGHFKLDFDNFDQYTHKQMEYCQQDVSVNVKMFWVLMKEKKDFGFPDAVFNLESETHRLMFEQTKNGFKLNKARAVKLLKDTDELLEHYTAELHKVFPTIDIKVMDYKPKYNKDGNMSAASKKKLLNWKHKDNGDGTFDILEPQVFNPNSPKQVGERLMSLGWNPRKFTATGQPSTAKDVLGEAIDLLALEVPEVEVLRKYNIVAHRNGIARDWLELAKEDGNIHGAVNHCGPWTHRCSHFEPNMANIARVQLDDKGVPIEGLEGNFGWDCRHCLEPKEGLVLVGADASGIQLRALAHYMDDPEYIKQVCEGDIHTVNQHAAGIHDRPTSKTFIYAWLLGAGDEKIGTIVGVAPEEYPKLLDKAMTTYKYNYYDQNPKRQSLLWWCHGKLKADGRWTKDEEVNKKLVCTILKGHYTKKSFLDNLPALKRFRQEEIPEAAKKGFMFGLDGRKIWVPSEHLAMGAYLQGFEAVIMKKALVMAAHQLGSDNVPFGMCGFIHDEIQWETYPEYAVKVGKTFVDNIRKAGEEFNSKCPLDGEYKVGQSWAMTH